jgi:hypothetical protein
MSSPETARLPFPMAVTWARVEASKNAEPATQLDALKDFHSTFIRTLALVSLAAYIERGVKDTAVDRRLATLLDRPPALGTWFHLTEDLIKAQRTREGSSLVAELSSFWLHGKSGRSDSASTLLDWITVRNQWAHEKLGDAGKPLLAKRFRERFASVVAASAWWTFHRMVVPLRAHPVNGGAQVDRLLDCTGLDLCEQDSKIRLPWVPISGEEALIHADFERCVRLHPLVFANVGGGTRDDLLLYEALHLHEHRRGEISRIEYVGAATRDVMPTSRQNTWANLVESFSVRLGPWINRLDAPHGGTDNGGRFAEMPSIVATAAQHRLGPNPVLDAVNLAVADGGGHLIVGLGAPGSGKSAALAQVAQKAGTIVHFVAPDGARSDVRLAARALAAQLISNDTARPVHIPEELGSALKAWHEGLGAVAARREKLVVVIDALDAMPRLPGGTADLRLLPSPIPLGVTFVVSCRAGIVANAIQARPQLVVVTLPPLDSVSLRSLAARLAPHADDAIRNNAVAKSEGNPLFLQLLLVAGGAHLPSTIQDACQSVLADAMRNLPDDGLVERAVGLLGVARSGLGRLDLARLLDLTPHQAGAVLRAIEPLLQEEDQRYRFFHSSVQTWVLEERTREIDRRSHHTAIASLLREQVTVGRTDALADLPYHLANSDEPSEAVALLDGEFLDEKVSRDSSLAALADDCASIIPSCGTDIVTAGRFGLLAALLRRAGKTLARAGVPVLLAQLDDVPTALSLARGIDDPGLRDELLTELAREVARRDRQRALAITACLHDANARDALHAQIEGGGPELSKTPPNEQRAAPEALLIALLKRVQEGDRAERARMYSLASLALAGPRANDLARRAVEEAKAESSEQRRATVLVPAIAALARFDEQAALELTLELPDGLARVRGIVAAKGALAGLEAATRLQGSSRHAALAHVLVRWARIDLANAVELATGMPSGPERDRVALELTTLSRVGAPTFASQALSLIVDPMLRIEGLSQVYGPKGSSDHARALVDPLDRSIALERLALLADRALAKELRVEADQCRALCRSVEGRAAAAREAAALVLERDPTRAHLLLQAARSADPSYVSERQTLILSARAYLQGPTLAVVRQGIHLSAGQGDVWAAAYPEFVATLAASFPGSDDAVTVAACTALDWAEARVAEIVAAGVLRRGQGSSSTVSTFDRTLTDAALPCIATGKQWKPVSGMAASLMAEAETLERKLAGGGADARTFERAVGAHLAMGDAEGAARILERQSFIAAKQGDQDAAAVAHRRADDIAGSEQPSIKPPSPPRMEAAWPRAQPVEVIADSAALRAPMKSPERLLRTGDRKVTMASKRSHFGVSMLIGDHAPRRTLDATEGPDPLVGSVIDSQFLVEEAISADRIGNVYRAADSERGTPMSIKILRTDLSKDVGAVQRFRQLARRASSLGSEHIVSIVKFGAVPSGAQYFVTELLEGRPLSEVVEADGPMSPERTVEIGLQACIALNAAHGAGVVHRDLKPDSIRLMRGEGGADCIKVCDFGIAAFGDASTRNSRTGSVFGSPEYMAPEQFAGIKPDPRTDIYALGVILFEMATARVPFQADNVMALLTKHLVEAPPRPSDLTPPVDVPPSLEAVMMKAMAKRPDDRYQAVEEMRADLQAIQEEMKPPVVTDAAECATSHNDTKSASRTMRSAGNGATESTNKMKLIALAGLIALGGIMTLVLAAWALWAY